MYGVSIKPCAPEDLPKVTKQWQPGNVEIDNITKQFLYLIATGCGAVRMALSTAPETSYLFSDLFYTLDFLWSFSIRF